MNDDVRALLTPPAFPRSNAYDPAWVLDNNMGPHPLWLMEWLCERVELRPGMRVLDLGCGKALTSIFLAKEYRARVWAADWWIGPDNNCELSNGWKRCESTDGKNYAEADCERGCLNAAGGGICCIAGTKGCPPGNEVSSE